MYLNSVNVFRNSGQMCLRYTPTTRVSRQFERNHPTTAAAESAPGNGTENFQSHHRAIDKVKKNYSAKHFLLNLLR